MLKNKYISWIALCLAALGLTFLYISYQQDYNLWGIFSGVLLSTAFNYFAITMLIEYTSRKENLIKVFNIKKYLVMRYLKQILFEANCMSSDNSNKLLNYDEIIMNDKNILCYIDILYKGLGEKKYGLTQINHLRSQLSRIDVSKLREQISTILVIMDEKSASYWEFICYSIEDLKNNSDNERYGDLLSFTLKNIKKFLA